MSSASIVQSDSSLRYVLPTEHVYLKNLAALYSVNCHLARRIDSTFSIPDYKTEPSKSGEPTIAITTADGKKIYLHSRYEPVAEAKSLADSIAQDEKFVLFIMGFALGYHVEAIADKVSSEAVLCIVEPDLILLRTAFSQRDYSVLIASGRLIFFTEADKSQLFMGLANHNGLLSVGSDIVHHPPSIQKDPAFFEQMEIWIGELRDYSRTALNTLILNGKKTAENITRNLGWYVATPGIDRLKNRYARKPAIIVSAGPSLRKNKHHLEKAVGKSIIIAVQTTLKPLIDIGIEPQFVTSLDYHEICTRFFEKLPPTLRTELIAEPKATNAIFKMHPGPLSVLGNDYAESLLHEMNLKKPKLQAGATVAHLAYYLAEHLGCDPIIFVGQDLGFSNGLCYSPGTSYEDVWRPEISEFCTMENKQWEQIVRDRPILRQIPDYQGRPMYTEERLFTYLQQFERDFGRTTTRIIDATEGGALKRGAHNMPLIDAIENFCTEEFPTDKQDQGGLDFIKVQQCVASLMHRRNEAKQIQQIASETSPLLEEVRDHLDDQPRVNKAIAKIDVLRNRMDRYGRCYDLITQLTQFSELQRFEQDRKLEASRAKGADRQGRQVQRDIANVKSVAEAAGEFVRMMNEVIEQLAAEHGLSDGEIDAANEQAQRQAA